MNTVLTEALKEMREVDQALRNSATGKIISQANYMVDQIHNTRLKRLIAQHGLPTPETVGAEGMENFWLLVQHQDTDLPFQKNCLEKCSFAPRQQAMLTDRVLLNSGESQVYGTQFQRDESGDGLIPRPISDPETVEERRAAVGLDTLAENQDRVQKRQEELDRRGA